MTIELPSNPQLSSVFEREIVAPSDDFYSSGIWNWTQSCLQDLIKSGELGLMRSIRDFDGKGGFMFGFQSRAWDEIVKKHDDGYTGAMYGLMCRAVQAWLKKELPEL